MKAVVDPFVVVKLHKFAVEATIAELIFPGPREPWRPCSASTRATLGPWGVCWSWWRRIDRNRRHRAVSTDRRLWTATSTTPLRRHQKRRKTRVKTVKTKTLIKFRDKVSIRAVILSLFCRHFSVVYRHFDVSLKSSGVISRHSRTHSFSVVKFSEFLKSN